jgi:hypothetical protein
MSSGRGVDPTLATAVRWTVLVLSLVFFFSGGFLWRVYHDCSVAFRQARGNILVAGLRGHEPS